MKMKTKVKTARAITVISTLTLWLGLLIGSIGIAMLVWKCNQPLGWKVMMTGSLIFFLIIIFSFLYALYVLDKAIAEAEAQDYIKSCKEHKD